MRRIEEVFVLWLSYNMSLNNAIVLLEIIGLHFSVNNTLKSKDFI